MSLGDPLVLHLILAAISLPALVAICRRAGAPWPVALLVLVPLVGLAAALSVLLAYRWPGTPDRPEA